MAKLYRIGNITYDLGKYWQGRDKIRIAREQIDELPEDIKNKMLQIGRAIAEGALQASKAVYEPLVDEGKRATATAQNNDFKTDFEGLKDISALF